MTFPFLDLKSINAQYRNELIEACTRVIDSGWYITGKELGKLKDGEEVIVPSNTYIASILAIRANDLVPVLVEPDVATYNLCPKQTEAAITAKTRSILPVHLYGQLADMPAIMAIADERKTQLKVA